MKHIFNLFLLTIPVLFHAQKGKDGIVNISSNSIVNEYTYLTSDASSGSSSISVNSSTLNDNSRFSGNLTTGDLLFIYQVQGASIDNSSFNYSWGQITNYNNCGNYEFVEVASVPNASTITFRCGLKNSYTAAGHVQVIRVPRYEDLTVSAEVTSPAWDGTTGGLVIIECETNVNITSSGSIEVSALGFRGGISEITNSYWGGGQFGSNDHLEGGAKGESIVGYIPEYNAINAERAQGAPANGGGGGDGHNSGGGGGSNGGDISNYQNGVGVPDAAYNTAWSLETPSISGIVSAGGGKGGYTFSGNNQNPLTLPPGDSNWGSDNRRNVGGRGGRPLDYSNGKIFFGGGGGAGDLNNSANYGGSGGAGGGLVFIRAYGDISGTGVINANGMDGEETSSTSPPSFSYAGEDGAGGAGAGGTIFLEAYGTVSGLTCNANGGKGGDQILVPGFLGPTSINEAEGPGGGGSGGKVIHTGGSFTSNLSGGLGGTTNSAPMSSFPYNGATGGGNGDLLNYSSNLYTLSADNDTICAGNSTTLIANVTGTIPSGTSIIWYDAPLNGNFIGAGTNFTTGNLSNDTTFYVGFCPGSYTIPVSVIMGTSFNYDTSSVIITDENCSQSDGSITGITISGGAQPLQYEWNAVLTVNQDLTGANAGTYTLVVTDNNGCAANLGSYTIGENTGPIVDTTSMTIVDDQCSQNIGSISGITVSGISPYTYSWNGQVNAGIDLTNIGAGLYDLEVLDAYGCSSIIQNIEVLDNSGPTIDTTSMALEDDHCSQGVGSISGISISGSSPYSYEWNGISASSVDTALLFSGLYELVVIDSYGCSDTVSDIAIQNISGPSIDTTSIIVTDETCESSNGAISNISITGSNPFTYYWNGAINTLDISNLTSGTYDILVEDIYGCQDSIIGISLGSHGFPSAVISYDPTDIFVGDSVTYTDESTGDIINSIFTLSDGSIVNDTMATELYLERGVFDICLTIENNYGCIDSSCIEITVAPALVDIIIPNIITPNMDGSNDYLTINGIEGLYSIEVFNRWGNIVYSESPYMNLWDGTSASGKELSEGTYYFVLRAIGETDYEDVYTGFVMLKR